MATVSHPGFVKFEFFNGHAVKRPILHQRTKFRKDWSNRCGYIAIFVIFNMRFLLNGGGTGSGAPNGVQGQSPWSGGSGVVVFFIYGNAYMASPPFSPLSALPFPSSE